MKLKLLLIICFWACIAIPFNSHSAFIAKRENLKRYNAKPNLVMIASTGRSGSTMLTEQIKQYIPSNQILKTHLLPPSKKFKGKILFIFSNPNQAAESALYMTLHHKGFAEKHFQHVETADHDWLKKIGDAHHQTKQDNLLSYDGLGTYEHLRVWLYTRTKPTDPDNAQILAIKYENLWDKETVQAIRSFLNLPYFKLPPKRARGRKKEDLFSEEIAFRKTYNLGTQAEPRYAAYDEATLLWEHAPSFQYLEILQE